VPGLRWGQVYAYRAINPFDPAYGLRFDPDEAIRDIERGNGTTARKMMGRAIRDRYVDVDPEPCDGSGMGGRPWRTHERGFRAMTAMQAVRRASA